MFSKDPLFLRIHFNLVKILNPYVPVHSSLILVHPRFKCKCAAFVGLFLFLITYNTHTCNNIFVLFMRYLYSVWKSSKWGAKYLVCVRVIVLVILLCHLYQKVVNSVTCYIMIEMRQVVCYFSFPVSINSEGGSVVCTLLFDLCRHIVEPVILKSDIEICSWAQWKICLQRVPGFLLSVWAITSVTEVWPILTLNTPGVAKCMSGCPACWGGTQWIAFCQMQIFLVFKSKSENQREWKFVIVMAFASSQKYSVWIPEHFGSEKSNS